MEILKYHISYLRLMYKMPEIDLLNSTYLMFHTFGGQKSQLRYQLVKFLQIDMKEASVPVFSPWLVETAVTLPFPISVHSFLPIWESLCPYFAFLYACMLCLVDQLCLTLCDPMDCSPPSSSLHGDSPGKYTGVGCHALLQRIFPTQGSNPGLPHCRWILYHLSHQGSPFIWVQVILD